MPTTPAPVTRHTRLILTLIWSIAALAALFMVWPVWRAFLPLEIWGNEGWNAYHADSAARGAGLYPPPDGLVANNYPPLSFFLIGWLGKLFGDPLYVGRALSLLGTCVIGLCASLVIRRLGGSRAAALLGGFWFVATMARFFEFYVGMNEPQILNLAVMAIAMVWFLKNREAGRAVEPAVLLMVAAGFVKHNFIAVPVVCLLRLACDDWRLGLRATIFGGVAAAIGLALCAWAFAPYFAPDMLFQRTYDWTRSFSSIGRLQFILPAMVLWGIWAYAERRSASARFTVLMIGVALVTCLAQKAGAGVDENAQFELIFMTAIGIGLAFDGLPRDPLRSGLAPHLIRCIVLGILIARLLISTRLEFAYVLLSPQYRAEAAAHAAIAHAEAARIAAMPGPVGCSNLVVCRMAGKPFVFDHFKVQMMLETGALTPTQLEAIKRDKGITLENIDPRAKATSIWRRMRSD